MIMMMLGAIAMSCFVASLFFIRFWRTTHDRFFLFFAASFAAEGVVRVVQGMMDYDNEQLMYIYLIRLLAFIMIIYAIADKNYRARNTK